MLTSSVSALSLAAILNAGLSWGNAQITAAARLAPRQADPAFVGYIEEDGGYSDARSCDYPQTVSTSGAYVQCCPTTGDCPFFTSCSSNTLLAEGATVPCDVDPALTCNTGIVIPTPGANGGGSYLACWQTSLGQNPFTFVQDIGSAVATGTGASSTGASTSGSTGRSSSTASRTSSATGSSASSSSGSAESSAASNAGNPLTGDLGHGIFGGIVAFFLALL